jgi:SAM-dependent methyltransferase
MEPTEYTTLFAQEENFWWYQGLRRLVEQELRRARHRWPAEGRSSDGAGPTPADAAGVTATRPLRILDAGCGTGGMTQRLAAHGSVTGLDWSPLALNLARRRGALPWIRGSVERLPFRTGTFDVVVSLDVLYHRGVESDLLALQEFRRCLRPGGSLILNLPAFESLRSSHDAAIHTARRYRRGPLSSLLRAAGLAPDRVTHWNAFLFPGLAAVRWMRRRAGEAEGTAAPSDVRSVPGPINSFLGGVLALERAWLARWDLPAGLSILAVAHKPDGAV